MALSTLLVLRNVIAACSTLLLVFSAVTIYKCCSAAILLTKTLPRGDYVWVDILGIAGSDRPETHTVNLIFDSWSENFIWVTAGFSFFAGLFGLSRFWLQERERTRFIRGMNYNTSRSKLSKLFNYMAVIFTAISAIASFISAEYIRHRINVQKSTCHWQMGQHHNVTLNCTRELAVCAISPYLLKTDISEKAVWNRQKACSQLTYSREILLLFIVLSSVMLIGYGVQSYRATRADKSLSGIEDEFSSGRCSNDEQSWLERSQSLSCGSGDGYRIEKAE